MDKAGQEYKKQREELNDPENVEKSRKKFKNEVSGGGGGGGGRRRRNRSSRSRRRQWWWWWWYCH